MTSGEVVGSVAPWHPSVSAQRLDLHARLGRGRDQGACAERTGASNDMGALLGRLVAEQLLEVEIEIG